jgi:UDP-glucose 4-epimerase
MQTILVIGGAGFIGSHTVVELVHAGFRPIIIDNFNNSESQTLNRLEELLDQKVDYYDQDYKDTKRLAEIIDAEKVTGVIHFAAYKAVGESVKKPLDYYDNNVSGFIDLLKLVINHGVANFVFSSSAAVYGNPPDECVTEETVCNPTSPYGWSKYMDEVILRDTCTANSSLGGISLRYFNVVGSHETNIIGELGKGMPQNLLPIVVEATAHKIPPLTIYGTDYPTPDGTCLRDYVHVVDLAKAHVAALRKLESGASGYHVYNIGTGKPTSVLQLIETFQSINNVAVPYVLGDRRPGDPAAYYASAAKAEQELNWKATKTTTDAVRDAWQWHEKIKDSVA